MLKLVEAPATVGPVVPGSLTFAMFVQAIEIGVILGDANAREVCRQGYGGNQREFERKLKLYCERLPVNDFRNVPFLFGPTKRPCFYRLRVVESGPDRGKLHVTIWESILNFEDA